MEEIEKQQIVNFCKDMENSAEEINGMQVITKITEMSGDMLRQAAISLRTAENRVIVFGSVFENKPNLVVAISDDLAGKFNAPALVRAAGKHIQGGGGGQPTLATAGGKNTAGVPDAVAEVLNTLKN